MLSAFIAMPATPLQPVRFCDDKSDMEAPLALAPTVLERDRVVEALKLAVSGGRLTLDEFQARLDAAFAAQTRAELEAIRRSVPAPDAPSVSQRHWAVLILIALLFVGLAGVIVLVRSQDSSLTGPRRADKTINEPIQPAASGNIPTVQRARCRRAIPFSQMQSALLNQPVALALPSAGEAKNCFAVAGLSTRDTNRTGDINVHLDLNLMSGGVTIPSGIGIDPGSKAKTQIYTNNDQGVVTIARGGNFTLGQLFLEWGHPLGTESIGNLLMLPDFPLYWFVNGKPVSNGSTIKLRNHDEIECFEDLRGSPIDPIAHYAFPPGY
jgi:hypothetical protein